MSLTHLSFLVALDVLGFTWLWASVAKLRDVGGFERASRDLLPPALGLAAPVGARLVPLLEAVLGILMVTHHRLHAVLSASCVLLGFFLLLLVRARRRGTTTACACFGTTTAGPISVVIVVRTGLLLLLGSALLAAESAGAVDLARPSAAQLGPGALVALLILSTVGVLSAAGRLLTTVEQTVRPGAATRSGAA